MKLMVLLPAPKNPTLGCTYKPFWCNKKQSVFHPFLWLLHIFEVKNNFGEPLISFTWKCPEKTENFKASSNQC